MKSSFKKQHQGFVLLPVVLAITLVAAVAFLINRESAMMVNMANSEAQSDEVKSVAKSGLQHALWAANNNACTGYALAPTSMGDNSYSAIFFPTESSPVTITAIGTLANGISHNLTRKNIKIYQASTTVILQPTTTGKDTFIEGESGHVNHNKTNDKKIKMSSETNKSLHSLLQFDLSTIPSSSSSLKFNPLSIMPSPLSSMLIIPGSESLLVSLPVSSSTNPSLSLSASAKPSLSRSRLGPS